MKNTEEKTPATYEVIVEIENLICLADDEKLKTLLSTASLQGKVSTNICFAQSDDNSLGMVKKFYLEYEEDFKSFAQTIINIDGVKNIKKGDGPWKRSWKERRQYKSEKKNIQQEKEKRAEASLIQRQKDLNEFNRLIEGLEKQLNEEFGNEQCSPKPISWFEFDNKVPAAKQCEVEFYFVLSDPLLGGFLEYKRESGTFNTISEVLEFFTSCINANLIAFYLPINHVRDIPIVASFREKNDKLAIALMASCGKPTFQLGFYRFYIKVI